MAPTVIPTSAKLKDTAAKCEEGYEPMNRFIDNLEHENKPEIGSSTRVGRLEARAPTLRSTGLSVLNFFRYHFGWSNAFVDRCIYDIRALARRSLYSEERTA